MAKPFWHSWSIGGALITAGLILLWCFCAILMEYFPGYVYPLKILDSRLYDLQFEIRGPVLPSGDVVLVEIDDTSFDRIGRWPWSRKIIADLYSKVADAKPRVVAITSAFTEPDTNILVEPIKSLREQYERLGPRQKSVRFFESLKEQEELADTDALLAKAIAKFNKVVLTYRSQVYGEVREIGEEEEEELFSLIRPSTIKLFILGEKHPDLVPKIVMIRPSIPQISSVTPYHGFLRYPVDYDGRIRFTEMVIEHKGDYYPSLEFLTAALSQNTLPGIRFGWMGVYRTFFGEEETSIPTLPSGRAFINYLGRGVNFPSVISADVLEGKINPAELKDKVVLIGVTSEAITRDLLATPVGNLVPGLVATASAVDMMIRKDFLSRPYWMLGLELILLALVSALLAIGLRGLGAWGGVLSTLFLMGGVVIVSHFLGFANGYVVSLAPMLCCFSSIYLVLSVYYYLAEEKKSAEVRNAFQHYLSPAVVQQVLGSPEQLVLGGGEKSSYSSFC
ncbi:CHASE2 domain-containing protein [Bdellovibrionota bacterium]